MTTPNPIQPTEKDVEKAKLILEESDSGFFPDDKEDIRLRDSIATALAEQREECARIAENYARLLPLSRDGVRSLNRDLKIRQQLKLEIAAAIRGG